MIFFAIIIGDDVGCVGVDDIIMNTVHVKLSVSLEVAYVGRKKSLKIVMKLNNLYQIF